MSVSVVVILVELGSFDVRPAQILVQLFRLYLTIRYTIAFRVERQLTICAARQNFSQAVSSFWSGGRLIGSLHLLDRKTVCDDAFGVASRLRAERLLRFVVLNILLLTCRVLVRFLRFRSCLLGLRLIVVLCQSSYVDQISFG